jgi:16S rRNA (cytidine1402-2'-O)-methyltransferase
VLYIIATPIGNLEDITLRAMRVLKEVDYILAEDTRKTQRLLQAFSIEKRLESFFDHNEKFKTIKIVEDLKQGKNIALVSDAGTPTICDPGYRLVRECRKEKISVTALPGACSVINALVLSAAPREKFIFVGYMPKKPGEQNKILCKIKEAEITAVILETPHRILKTLDVLREFFGERKITATREMTKKFEEVIEATAAQCIEQFQKHPPKGEMVLVVYRED